MCLPSGITICGSGLIWIVICLGCYVGFTSCAQNLYFYCYCVLLENELNANGGGGRRGYADAEIEAVFAKYDADGDSGLNTNEQGRMQTDMENDKVINVINVRLLT